MALRMAFQITSFMQEKVIVHPPTIFCRILHVLPSTAAPECRWAVTVADGQGVTVTVDLSTEELQTYERFQAGAAAGNREPLPLSAHRTATIPHAGAAEASSGRSGCDVGQ